MNVLKKNIILICFVFTFSSCRYYKQISRHEIEGYVFRDNKSPIPDAKVVFFIKNIKESHIFLSNRDSTTTDKNGHYTFPEVSYTKKGVIGGDKKLSIPLSYHFLIKKKGFKTDTIDIRSYPIINNIIKIDSINLIPNN